MLEQQGLNISELICLTKQKTLIRVQIYFLDFHRHRKVSQKGKLIQTGNFCITVRVCVSFIITMSHV